MKSARLVVTGRVQGVGFRAWTVDAAARLRVSGWVRNRIDGSVEAAISGSPEAVEAMASACGEGPRLARVDDVAVFECPLPGGEGFVILPTE